MTNNTRDTLRTLVAVKSILDGRSDASDSPEIMVTLERTVTAALLLLTDNDPRRAAAMLNESLVSGVENRLAFYNSLKVKGLAP